MAVRKIAISVPEEVLKQVDRQARRFKSTRSGFITRVLCHVSSAADQEEITEALNRFFEDEALSSDQKETARAFLSVAEKNAFEDEEW
jgi:metal-responsive CopG/Arc/MetJ family transcriptional regulator